MEKWMMYAKKADFAQMGVKHGVDPVTARIIRNRDLVEDKEIHKFLYGGMDDLYDPHLLKDGDLLVDILLEKIEAGAHIRVIGDYDIDGVMSSYILKSALMCCGANVSVQIPDRIKDGYGLNVQLIEEAHENGVDTILTCDNGIAAMEEIALAKAKGMTVLVTDHHAIPFEMEGDEKHYLRSLADAIVNPHQNECGYPFKELCGAAVAWKVVCILFERKGLDKEEANQYLENVAFATVGDVMDLVDENRILVKEGIKRIHHTQNVGMQALIEQCQIPMENVDAFHFGFVLGPCINASGRLDTARRALELFFQTSKIEALKMANELVILNQERKDLTLDGVELAKEIYEQEGYDKYRVLVIYLPGVHESIAGIIAGRIREYYEKPTFILTDGEEGIKGSGRSIEAYSMYEEMCQVKDLFTKFGGHPMAAGLSMEAGRVDEFRQRINEACQLTAEDMVKKIQIDVPMPMDYVSMDLVREFDLLAPFGKGNTKPVFATKNVGIQRMWIIGKNQNVLRMTLKTEAGQPVSGIFFGDLQQFQEFIREQYGDAELQRALDGRDNSIRLSFIYYPKINEFRGEESLQFEIQHYC